MSFLNRVEDWIVRHTLKPLQPWQPWHPIGHPPEDDVLITVLLYIGFMVSVGCTIGNYLAK